MRKTRRGTFSSFSLSSSFSTWVHASQLSLHVLTLITSNSTFRRVPHDLHAAGSRPVHIGGNVLDFGEGLLWVKHGLPPGSRDLATLTCGHRSSSYLGFVRFTFTFLDLVGMICLSLADYGP